MWSVRPLTQTICSHTLASMFLCSVLKEGTAHNIVTYPCREDPPATSSGSLWSFLLIPSLGWRLILSCAFLRADAQADSWGRRQSFGSPSPCSWFSHFHQCRMGLNPHSGRTENGYTRCNGQRDTGSIDLADHEWIFAVSFRNVHKVWCQEQR